MIDVKKALNARRLRRWGGNESRTRIRPNFRRETPCRPLDALGIALWLGLVTGPAELVLTRIQKPLVDPSAGLFRMNRHMLWSVPLVDFAILLGGGAVLACVLRLWPRLGVRATVGPLVFVALLPLLLTCRWLHVLACLAIALLVAIRLSTRMDRRFPALMRRVRRTLPIGAGLLVATLALSSAGPGLGSHNPSAAPVALPQANSPGRHPNVLLIVLDTVRADHLGFHGYGRKTSPNLDRLAPRGIVFEQARATAPWTLPSHASMMTGRWPHELSAGIHTPLDGEHITLAEYLGSQGYATAGFVGNATYCGLETGLGRGFGHFEDHQLSTADLLWTTALGQRILLRGPFGPERRTGGNPVDFQRKDAEQVCHDLKDWLVRQQDRPFFAFLNLYDAHDPYIPPAGFVRRFSASPRSDADLAIFERWFVQDKKKLSPETIERVLDAYDEGIAYLDEQVGRLIDQLDRDGLLAKTIVIITADHGEELGDHGLYGHASSLYDAEVHVPLLLLLPAGEQAGRTVAQQVSLRDLAVTIAELTGAGGCPFPGRSLARFWSEGSSQSEEPSLIEVDVPVMSAPNQGRSPVFRGPMKAVAFGKLVFIRNGDGREELFDVEVDRTEARNLVTLPQSGPVLDRFRTQLARLTGLQ